MCLGWEIVGWYRLPRYTLKKGSNMPVPIIDDSVVSGITKFLEALNSNGGTPIEQLSPKDARQVLIDAQNRVPVDLSGIERS